MSKNSDFSNFYKLTMEERREIIGENTSLDEEDTKKLEKFGSLGEENSDSMIENVIGSFELPLGIVPNMEVNEKEYIIPMVTEESSVVAACSYMAKLANRNGGVRANATKPIMIGQIEINEVPEFEKARQKILENKDKIKERANSQDKVLIKFGGGFKGLKVRKIAKKDTLVVHLHIDVQDAMGANAVNTMCEAVSPLLEEITGGEANLRILSNLADKRLVKAEVEISPEDLEREKLDIEGEKVIEYIVDAYKFAEADPYRATTHNKGIMNGIDAVVIATGNDFRAIESGSHSFAASSGEYKPLTTWKKTDKGNLKGEIEIPLALGTIGGATKIHPMAQISMKLLDVDSAQELAEVVASVGLLQNLGALRALATEGIQRGHMRLHAKNIAKQAGAEGEEVQMVASKMIDEGDISQKRAGEILEEN